VIEVLSICVSEIDLVGLLVVVNDGELVTEMLRDVDREVVALTFDEKLSVTLRLPVNEEVCVRL
jgi:transcription termination factor Rho